MKAIEQLETLYDLAVRQGFIDWANKVRTLINELKEA